MGSFKLSYDDIKKKLLQFDEEVITQNALENFIKFLPNREQVVKLIYKHHWADFNRTIFNFALLRPYFIESSFIINCRFYNLTGDMTEMSPQHLFTGFSKQTSDFRGLSKPPPYLIRSQCTLSLPPKNSRKP